PRYNKTRCFETFPFPNLTAAQAEHIRDLAERLDAHRKRQQDEHPNLTLTGMYNALEKLRSGEALNDKERTIHAQGLVTILQELHDAIDRAVFEAYGWSDLANVLVGRPGATTPLPNKTAEQAVAEEELLTRLAALNAQRVAEEVQGHVRWMRPEYQAPDAVQTEADLVEHPDVVVEVAETTQRPNWPKSMPDQVNAVRNLLVIGPQSTDTLSAHFKRKPAKSVEQVLAALEVLGQAQQEAGRWHLV
ncbi:MAG: class I SAM-dependent DNA methyltransferase, partial [Thioalkalivibrio sp.]